MTLPLSVLELAPVSTGSSSTEALRNSLELARLVDRLGFTRIWFAEHHNMPSIASTAPEVMIAQVAQLTGRIQVGSGGVMLPNHAPLKVAETYKLLEALHPGRINLGIGRAPGTDLTTAAALRRSGSALGADDFPQQLAELRAFGQGSGPAASPFYSVTAYPDDVPLPPIWLLGSSGYSAQLSAKLGLGFSFAAHFSPEMPEGPMLSYRRQFTPGALERPHAILAVSVICAEKEEDAERLARSIAVAFARMRTGRMGKLLSPEEAAAWPLSPTEQAVAAAARHMVIVGEPAEVRRQIEDLAARTEADEVMITTMIHGHRERLRSFELVAEVFGLKPT